MNKNLLSFITFLFFGASLIAQDKAEITVKITKDGELVKDTTYSYSDISKAKHAIHMMEMMSSDEVHFEESHEKHMKAMASGDHGHNKMIFIDEDGEVTEMKGKDMTWVTSSSTVDGDSKKVYTIEMKGDADGYAFFSDDDEGDEHVFINKEDGKFEVIVKDGGDHNVTLHKEVIVIHGDEKGKAASWTIEEGEDGEVIVISEDGVKIIMIEESQSDDQENGKTVKWVSDDSNGNEDIKVFVIKKESDGKEEVELEVIIEEKKSSKKKNKKKKK